MHRDLSCWNHFSIIPGFFIVIIKEVKKSSQVMEREPVLQIEAYRALMLLCTDGTDED